MPTSPPGETAIDLVCWDFGDTLVDERFMQHAPPDLPGWPAAYRRCFGQDPGFADRLDVGDVSLHELIGPLAAELGITRAEAARHLRSRFHHIEWLPGMRELVGTLNGRVLQAVVTVNPHEFGAMAVVCGLDRMVDVIVTSADVASLSKPVMAERARQLLGLSNELSTSLLVDNKVANTEEFVAAGGRAIHYRPETFGEAWAALAPDLETASGVTAEFQAIGSEGYDASEI